jgi:TatA/E family protein of Tat protein translocase
LFGIGGWELAILFLFGFLIFGPDKMPQIARTIGRAVRQFRSAQEQMNKVIKAEVYDPLKDIEPLTNPFAGFSLDDTKKDAGKKAPEKKSSDKSTDKAGSDSKAATDTDEGSEKQGAADKKVDKPKVTGDVMQAAIASEAEKARQEAVEQTSKKTAAASTTTESFAQRRARLEKEHAQTKAVKPDDGAEASMSANPAPITETKVDSAAVKPADVVVSSDTGEEEERG